VIKFIALSVKKRAVSHPNKFTNDIISLVDNLGVLRPANQHASPKDALVHVHVDQTGDRSSGPQ